MKIWKGSEDKVTCNTTCVRFPGLRADILWNEQDAIPFIYSRELNVIVIGESNQIHWDLFNNGSYVFNGKTYPVNRAFGNNFVAGRIWEDRRIVTFYNEIMNPFPSSMELSDIIRKLDNEHIHIADYTLVMGLEQLEGGICCLVTMPVKEYLAGGFGGYEEYDDFAIRCRSVDIIDANNPDTNKQPEEIPSKIDRFPGDDEYTKLMKMRQWNGYSDVSENKRGKKIIVNESQLRKILSEIASVEIDERAEDVNLNPTDAQKEAGNYKMAHISVKGMEIAIENPKGSYRKFKNEDGTTGHVRMNNHYGYFNITKGKDGDAVDVFIGPSIDNFENVYCVDQNNKQGEFDETKVMLGFTSKEEAKNAYMSNYSPGWKGFRAITGVSLKVFKKWLYRGRKQRQPFADYVYIQKKKLDEAYKIGNPEQNAKFRQKVEEVKPALIAISKNGGFYFGSDFLTKYTISQLASYISGFKCDSFMNKTVSRAVFELEQKGINFEGLIH